MRTRVVFHAAISMALALASGAAAEPLRGQEPVSFKRDIAPLLLDNCLACHGPKKAEGGYRIDTFQRAVSAGDSQAAAFSANDLAASEAYRRMTSADADERMPLEGDPLPAEQLAVIQRWIEQGLNYDGGDPAAALSAIVPPPQHPAAPASYAHALPITALAFSPDGARLYVAGYHELTVWNVESGELVQRLGNLPQRIYDLDFSPDGSLLAVSGGNPGRLGEVRLLNAAGELQRVVAPAGDVVFSSAFHPSGQKLACGSAEGTIRIVQTADGAELLSVASHSDWVLEVAYSDDGGKFASASRDKTSKVFDAEKGELLATYAGHGQPVKGVAFHPAGDQIYSGGADNKIHLWKVADSQKTADVASFGGEVYRFFGTSGFIFVPSADKTFRQFDRNSKAQVRSYDGSPDWVLCGAWHEGTQRVAAGGFNGEVRIWKSDDGAHLRTILAAPGMSAPGQ